MMEDMAILYGVPKVAYGAGGCTPFPMCVRACAEYLGISTSYTQVMAESGAAFRLTWNTECWDGGNVDSVFAYDNPQRTFINGMRVMGWGFKALERSPETSKEAFKAFIREEIDAGNPVIALGIIGPPEACIITGYRDGGNTLMGWNFFQEYPEYQGQVQFEECGYFITDSWWDNPDTWAVFATGAKETTPFTTKEVLQNAIEVLEGRIYEGFAKGIQAYDAWKKALLNDKDFPSEAIMPMLVEHMMCHGDAMDCLSDGRHHAAKYMRELAAKYPQQGEKLEAVAKEFDGVVANVWEMIHVLGGWERGEAQMRRLAEPETRRMFGALIDKMKAHDERALAYMRELAESL